MAAGATQTRPNTVKVSDAGPSRKKLEIQIPAESVSEKLNESLETLRVEAALPGFRRGKAPMELIRKRFGGEVKREAKNQLVAGAYQRAVEDHKLKVVGDPFSQSLPGVEIEEGKALAFEVEVEVMPEFEVPSLDGLEVKRPTLVISDDMVSKELDRLCLMEGALEERDEPQAGDYLTGHGIMKGPDGKEFYNINGAVVQVPTRDKKGQGMILGVMVDDLEKQLGKPRAGDMVTIKSSGPAQHEVEAIRGTALTITFQVNRIDRIIPAKAGDLAARYGMGGEGAFREAVKGRMEQRVQGQQQTVMRQQAARFLVDHATMDLPERLTAQQAARFLERARADMMHRGLDQMQIEENVAKLRGGSVGAAVRDLKLLFVLNRLAEEFKVSVDEGEINGYIARMAFDRGERPEKLRQTLIQTNQVGAIWQAIREHKTLDAVIGRGRVTEVSAEEWERQAKAFEASAG
ncbi:MAG: trigger factor [Phycisphaerae bacterium]|nr:trigger factor [Phycisphaerae bacterium]